ncbi:MAG: MlaA family lipoprotein [Gammaproteobacteria bacterium]
MNAFRKSVLALLGLITIGLNGCATDPYGAYDPDPIEPVNRIMYGVTDLADRAFLEPVADFYILVTPAPVRDGVTNFFDNLGTVNVIVNDLLQGKVEQGASDTARLAINSTIGLLGVFDVATSMGFEAHDEDLGQTLGVWGFGEGPYLFVPFYGPNNARDLGNIPMSFITNPMYYIWDSSVTGPLSALSIVNNRANLKTASRVRDEAALDPYVFTREAYRQNRMYKVYDGDPPTPGMDEALDEALEAELNGL